MFTKSRTATVSELITIMGEIGAISRAMSAYAKAIHDSDSDDKLGECETALYEIVVLSRTISDLRGRAEEEIGQLVPDITSWNIGYGR